MKNRFSWRHQYDEARDQKEGDLAALRCEDPSLTQQHFTKDADINEIARRFGLNDIPSAPILDASYYRDTTADPSLMDILEARRAVQDHFMGLPAKLRRRFHNSPSELWNFVTDPENAEEAIRLGLLTDTPTSASATAGTADSSPTAPGAPTTTTNANAPGENAPRPPE